MTLRDRLRRYPALRAVYHRVRALRQGATGRAFGAVSLSSVPPETAVRLAYQVILHREPDPVGFTDRVGQLRAGTLSRVEMTEAVRGSEEFENLGFGGRMLGASVHAGRCRFIRGLPRGARIVDLGGTHLARDVGALVALGYPYPFEELTIVDLPSPDRHELYRSTDERQRVESPLGPVLYRYHSMTDLGGFDDASVDLFYSGQSIEHVTPDEGRHVLKEAHRILRPGGHIAIDTPNGRVTRLMQAEFIDPDHKVEYTWPELAAMLVDAGLEVVRAQGLNYAGRSAARGRFDAEEASRHCGLYDELEDCYILAVVARKPLPDR